MLGEYLQSVIVIVSSAEIVFWLIDLHLINWKLEEN